MHCTNSNARSARDFQNVRICGFKKLSPFVSERRSTQGRTVLNSYEKSLNVPPRFGEFLVALLMVYSCLVHFKFAQFVAAIVPSWMPGRLFWAYFTGVALLAAGISIVVRRWSWWKKYVVPFSYSATNWLPRDVEDGPADARADIIDFRYDVAGEIIKVVR
jgi:hypothetical protein